MDKQTVFNMAKEELKKIVDELSIDNLDEKGSQIRDYLTFLDSLVKIRCSEATNNKTNQTAQTEGSPVTILEDETDETHKNIYRFERKLKGGYIEEIDSYVPEAIIRQLALHDGDIVRAIPKSQEGNKKFYHFELVKKGTGTDPNRSEIKYGIVDHHDGIWICNKTLSGEDVKVDDLPFSMRIKEFEVREFNLAEGDIIDIAYYTNNPLVSKVVWKHKIDDEGYSTPLPSGFYKDKSASTETVTKAPHLTGKTITMVGCTDRQSIYRDRFTALGATFQGVDGKESDVRIAALIKKSDIVLIMVPAVSHAGSDAAKKHSKAHDVPFTTVDSIGITSVVNSATNLARRIESHAG